MKSRKEYIKSKLPTLPIKPISNKNKRHVVWSDIKFPPINLNNLWKWML